MGKVIIKEEGGKEVAYEEGWFGDRKIGELHENWDGSKETRNFSGPHVTIERECDNIFDFTNFNKNNREGSVDSERGVFNKDTTFGYETENSPSFKRNQASKSLESRTEYDSGSSYDSHDSSSYSNSNVNSEKGSFFENFLLGLGLGIGAILFFGYLSYITDPNKTLYHLIIPKKNNPCKVCDNYYNNVQIDYNRGTKKSYKIEASKYP